MLDYGSGNLHSVSRALAHAGGAPIVTGDPRQVAAADALVIPGVGHFGHCVRAIRSRGLDVAITDAIASGRPVFGVCVGMQVLLERSEEDPEAGLAVLAGGSRRLHADVPRQERQGAAHRMERRHVVTSRTRTWTASPTGRGSTSSIPTRPT